MMSLLNQLPEVRGRCSAESVGTKGAAAAARRMCSEASLSPSTTEVAWGAAWDSIIVER